MARKPIKLSQHIRACQRLLDIHGDMDIVYSIDDEGNAFHKVWWGPSLGYWNEKWNEYLSEEHFEEELKDIEHSSREDYEQVVCIN
jgi:hypothetical protein